MEFKIDITVSPAVISDTIVAAVEGGSGYWLNGFQLTWSEKIPTAACWYADHDLCAGDFKIACEFDDPESNDGAQGTKVITPEDVKGGLEFMLRNHIRHFADMMNENGDAITADVFIQCVLFKDVIYG